MCQDSPAYVIQGQFNLANVFSFDTRDSVVFCQASIEKRKILFDEIRHA